VVAGRPGASGNYRAGTERDRRGPDRQGRGQRERGAGIGELLTAAGGRDR
jgi:hypothetical protein